MSVCVYVCALTLFALLISTAQFHALYQPQHMQSLYTIDQKEEKRMENLFSKVLVKSLFLQHNGIQVAGRQAYETSDFPSWCTVSIQ